VLWIALAVLALIRLIAARPGSMAGWGFGVLRFSPPLLGWSAWVVAALMLVPPLARPVERVLARAAARTPGSLGTPALALATAALVWCLPDQLHLVGDFLLRHGTAERALEPAALFPQALPLDVLLHYRLPRFMADFFHVEVSLTERALGALEAGILAGLSSSFARALGLTGARRIAATLVALCGGFLGLYTGYGKAIAEMLLLTVATAVLALDALRDGRALLPLGAVVAIGLTLHRSALALLPATALAWWLAARQGRVERRSARTWIALGLPVVTLAVMTPRIVLTLLRFDPVHFTPLEGGSARAALATIRGLDLLSVVAMLSPLALAIPAMAWALGRRAHATPIAWILGAVALPWFVLLLVIHPPQGIFRDWDDYAAAGAALSLIAAWLVALALGAPRWGWLAVAAPLACLAPTLQGLALTADVDRGLARVAAFLTEPPRRSDVERGKTWDFLGIRNAQLGRWDASAEAMARAAETSPSPRVLLQWALAEQSRGNEVVARDAFRRVTALTPDDARAWYGLAAESWRLGDYDECRRAAAELERLDPGSPEVARLLQALERVQAPNVPQTR
jgi:tetratricopeptide (TPR) repeat protein